MKSSSLKLLLSGVLLFVSLGLFAQADQTVCQDETENYAVDTAENGGTGTTDSEYVWTVTPNDGGTYNGTHTNDPSSPTSGNNINLDWGATTPGFYTVTVVETTNGCEGSPVSIIVEVVGPPTAPNLSAISPICPGSDAVFTFTGTAGDVITYTLDGGVTTATVTLVDDGTGVGVGTVTVTEPTADQTIAVVSFANDAGCTDTPTTPITTTVTIGDEITVLVATDDPDDSVCINEGANFVITGTEGTIVTYNINGGPDQTDTIPADGTLEIPADTSAAVDQVLTVTNVELGDCENELTTANTATLEVNPTPTTTPIQHTP